MSKLSIAQPSYLKYFYFVKFATQHVDSWGHTFSYFCCPINGTLEISFISVNIVVDSRRFPHHALDVFRDLMRISLNVILRPLQPSNSGLIPMASPQHF